MAKFKLEVQGNTMIGGKAVANLPMDFNGSAKINDNHTTDVKQIVFVRDRKQSIESLLLENLSEETPPEKIEAVVSAIKSLQDKNLDSVSESLFKAQITKYLKMGKTVIGLAGAILPILGMTP